MQTSSRLARAAALCLLAACAPAPSDEPPEVRLLPIADEAEGPPFQEILARHRAFFRELTDSAGVPGQFIASLRFVLHDVAAGPPRTLPGRPGGGIDYFRTHALELDSARMRIEEVEAHVTRYGAVVVVATHAAALPSIGTWQEQDDGWFIVSLTLNVEPDAIDRIRQNLRAEGARPGARPAGPGP
jgi:hypothetical protein